MKTKLEALRHLLEIIDRLRSPGGCPWDREQTLESLAPHLLEEAYEVADAVVSGSPEAVCEELGDLLMVIAMMCRIGEESGALDLTRAAQGIAAKLIRRHPHVFAAARADTPDQVRSTWEGIKREEKSAAGADPSLLAGIPAALPALQRATRISHKAASAGFDWPDPSGPAAKVREELEELLEAARDHPPRHPRIAEELGDLLFAAVNLARHLQVDPELALRGTIERFTRRFHHVETHLDKPPSEATLEEMEALWQESKSALPPDPPK